MPYDATIPNQDPLHQAQVEQLFSLKEWMVAISGKLDRLEAKLDTKADLSHVQAIDTRLGVVERQIVEERARNEYIVPQHTRMLEDVGVLKQKVTAINGVDSYKRWVWATAFVAAASVVTSLTALLHI